MILPWHGCAVVVGFFALGVGSSVSASVASYDGSVYPESAGWERLGTQDAERWLEDGWFYQYPRLGEWEPGPLGEADFYQRSLAMLAGAETFFLEWRMETTAPGVLLDTWQTPVVLVAGGSSGTKYHFTVTADRVRVIRDNFLPIITVDVEPDVAHIFRLELVAQESYAWYIDGHLVDSGAPEGPYPTSSSVLVWGAQHVAYESTTRWDYISYGQIPEPMTVLLLLPGAVCLTCWRRQAGG